MGRVDYAICSGAVHNDSTVVISIGLNDFGGFGAVDNQNLALFDPPAVARDFTANMRTVADRIRSHAPDAHIVMTGSLPTVDRANTTFCALNVVPDFPWARRYRCCAMSRTGTATTNGQLPRRWAPISWRSWTAPADMAPVPPHQARFVAGIIDTATPDYNMAFHPSDAGSQYVANTVAGRL